MKPPLLISVPHAGLLVPEIVRSDCVLSKKDIVEDGDEGAAEVYDFADEVAQYVTTDVARAVLDMNRPEDDRGADGVVKTHTCWNVPVYRGPLSEDKVEELLETYYRPYHGALESPEKGVVLGIDCHTMAAVGPPIGPGPGIERPAICLSNADGTCPREWIGSLADCLERSFGEKVSINHPFKGGYIIRRHSDKLPWAQLELSRAPFAGNREKRRLLLEALGEWCASGRR
jgi:formiminoglutamase